MLGMYGNEQLTTSLGKTSSGLSMLIWRRKSVNMLKRGTYLQDGWNGCQGKKLGMLLFNFKKEWDNLKGLKKYYTDIYNVSQR